MKGKNILLWLYAKCKFLKNGLRPRLRLSTRPHHDSNCDNISLIWPQNKKSLQKFLDAVCDSNCGMTPRFFRSHCCDYIIHIILQYQKSWNNHNLRPWPNVSFSDLILKLLIYWIHKIFSFGECHCCLLANYQPHVNRINRMQMEWSNLCSLGLSSW